jgi:ABC-type multidrug transport system ATPase subunit
MSGKKAKEHTMQASAVAIREKVGYLAQDPRYYDHLIARETLRFTAHFFYKGPSRALEKCIEETLDRSRAARAASASDWGSRSRRSTSRSC